MRLNGPYDHAIVTYYLGHVTERISEGWSFNRFAISRVSDTAHLKTKRKATAERHLFEKGK